MNGILGLLINLQTLRLTRTPLQLKLGKSRGKIYSDEVNLISCNNPLCGLRGVKVRLNELKRVASAELSLEELAQLFDPITNTKALLVKINLNQKVGKIGPHDQVQKGPSIGWGQCAGGHEPWSPCEQRQLSLH